MEIDARINLRGFGTAMPQYMANFSQRGAVLQHIGRQRMAKLMRTIGRGLDASKCEVVLNHICNTGRTTQPADGCFGPQKDVATVERCGDYRTAAVRGVGK